jgi:hypothetical protein
MARHALAICSECGTAQKFALLLFFRTLTAVPKRKYAQTATATLRRQQAGGGGGHAMATEEERGVVFKTGHAWGEGKVIAKAQSEAVT